LTVTFSGCDVTTVCDAGLTVTVGVISGVTVTVADPDPLAYTAEPALSGE
jgi:hypothetical protein